MKFLFISLKMLTRSHSLKNARKAAAALLAHTKLFIEQKNPLLNLPEIDIESLLVGIQSSTALTYLEVFEFVKIAASYQSDPQKSLLSIAEEAEKV
jgi:hypothetical protein